MFEERAKWGWFGWDKLGEDGKPVYPVDKKFSEDKLTEIEKHNIKVILEEEQKIKDKIKADDLAIPVMSLIDYILKIFKKEKKY